jgi:hypothetical protein
VVWSGVKWLRIGTGGMLKCVRWDERRTEPAKSYEFL